MWMWHMTNRLHREPMLEWQNLYIGNKPITSGSPLWMTLAKVLSSFGKVPRDRCLGRRFNTRPPASGWQSIKELASQILICLFGTSAILYCTSSILIVTYQDRQRRCTLPEWESRSRDTWIWMTAAQRPLLFLAILNTPIFRIEKSR